MEGRGATILAIADRDALSLATAATDSLGVVALSDGTVTVILGGWT
jgi:hypothetical protein